VNQTLKVKKMENNNELMVNVTNKLQENKFTQLPDYQLTDVNQNYWISSSICNFPMNTMLDFFLYIYFFLFLILLIFFQR
jgi:hypothetical protein